MSQHKKLFLKVAEKVATIMDPHGFCKHPVYDDGWDKHNQEYSGNLIQRNTNNFIDQFATVYNPSRHEFRFEVKRSKNTLGISNVEDMKFNPSDWTDKFLYKPFTHYTLKSGNKINPFSGKLGFKVSKSDNRDIDKEVAKLVRGFEGNLHYLLGTLDGSYKGGMVDDVQYDIDRPE